MKATTTTAVLALAAAVHINAIPVVDTTYPYTGPAIPIGDWIDNSVNGNGRGFPRLVEAPAVKPSYANPTNNINVISLSYLPKGIHVHFQTPFGFHGKPHLKWGTDANKLNRSAKGTTRT